jgi:O-antigen ligase
MYSGPKNKTHGIYDLNLNLLLAGSIFFIPFYFSQMTVDPVLIPRFTAWAILTHLLIIGVFVQSRKNRHRFDFNIISRTVFHLAFWYVCVAGFSLVNAVNLSEGLFEWLKILLSFAFFYVVILIFSAHKNLAQILTKSVAILGAILPMIGILQYFQIAFTSIPGNHPIYGTMANKFLNSSALFLILPFVFYGIYRFGGIWLGTCCAATAASFYVIFLNETRSVWVAILISGLIICLLFQWVIKKLNLSKKLKNALRKRSLLMLVVIAGTVFAANLTQLLNQVDNSVAYQDTQNLGVETPAVPDRPLFSLESLMERFQHWNKSLQMVSASPLIGVGTGQWKIILPSYGKIDKTEEFQGKITEIQFVRPHNDFLWVLSENGLAGFILYGGFILTVIIYALRIVRQFRDFYNALFFFFMLFGLIGYVIIAFFGFPKERIFHSIFLMLMAGSIVSKYHQVFPKTSKNGGYKIRILHLAVVFFLSFSVFVGMLRFKSDLHTRNALAAHQAEDWELVISEIDKADSWFYSLDPTATPLMWYRGMANYYQGHKAQALADFKRAYRHHPNHIHVLNNIGTCYALLHYPEKAVKYYRKALAIAPGFEKCLMNLRQLNGATEKHRDSRDISQRSNS